MICLKCRSQVLKADHPCVGKYDELLAPYTFVNARQTGKTRFTEEFINYSIPEILASIKPSDWPGAVRHYETALPSHIMHQDPPGSSQFAMRKRPGETEDVLKIFSVNGDGVST